MSGITGQTLSLFGAALKRNYHGPIVDQLNNLSPLYRLLSKREEYVAGDGLTAFVPIKIRRNQGIAAVADGGVLPTARYVKTKQLEIPLMYNYGAIEFTGPAIAASQKSAWAFANVVDLEVSSMVEGMKVEINRQLYTPASGYICMTNGADQSGSNSTVTVDNPGTQLLDEGMPIRSFPDTTSGSAVGDSDLSEGLTESTSHIIGNILSSTTFQLSDYTDAEITTEKWATNRFIFRYSNRGNEMNGLMDLIDDYSLQGTSSWYALGLGLQTIHGLSRSTYPILEAKIRHNSNSTTAITEERIQDLLDDIEKASGKNNEKSKNLIIMTTYGARKKYWLELSPDRRYNQPLKLTGGWQALAFQSGSENIPLISDRHCTSNTMFVIDRRFMAIYRASNFDWMDRDGNMLQRKIDSAGRYDAYEAILYCYQNLGCTSFKNQGALRDISE